MDSRLFAQTIIKFPGGLFIICLLLSGIMFLAAVVVADPTYLEGGLEGYADYKKRVRHKQIPLEW